MIYAPGNQKKRDITQGQNKKNYSYIEQAATFNLSFQCQLEKETAIAEIVAAIHYCINDFRRRVLVENLPARHHPPPIVLYREGDKAYIKINFYRWTLGLLTGPYVKINQFFRQAF